MDQTTNFIAGRVRRAMLNRAWLALIIVLIVGFIFAVSSNLSTLFTPIQHLGDSSQITIAQLKRGTAVTLTAQKIINTGMYYTGDNSGSVGAIPVKDGYVIVVVPSSKTSVFNQANTQMTGTVSTLASEISTRLTTAERAATAPMQFNYGSSWVLLLGFTYFAALVIVVLTLYFISRLLMMTMPERARVYRRLVKKGSAVSVADLASKLDEAAANGTLTKVGKTLYFCPGVMAYFTGAVGQLHPTSDLLWIYPHVVRRRVYGVRAGSNWSVVLCFADKRQANSRVKNEDMAKQCVQQLLGIYPNMLSGYSPDRAAKFKTGDMDSLRAEIQNRPPSPAPVPTGPDAAPHDPALLSGLAPSAAVASDTPYEQDQRYYGRTGMLTSKTDKEMRKDIKAIKAARKAAGAGTPGTPTTPAPSKRQRGEFDARDVSAPPAGMQASAPKEATAPKEEKSFGLGDDEFGGDF